MKSVLLSEGRFIKLEKSELDSSLGKGRMVVEHVVSAVIVVIVSAVACVLTCVPDVGEICHCLRFLPIELVKEVGVHRSAVAVHSSSVKVKCACEKVFVACHDVRKVSHRLRCMSLCSDVNVNSAAS